MADHPSPKTMDESLADRAQFSVEPGETRSEGRDLILTPQAISFLVMLHDRFEKRRQDILSARQARDQDLQKGGTLDFVQHEDAQKPDWKVAPAPKDLDDRRVEITGPTDAKMVINALNSGAKVFMADCEDSCSPTWHNSSTGQVNLYRAVRRELRFEGTNGKKYELGQDLATLVVRPRGWHLNEKHLLIDSKPLSASLFDFGLYFFHNAKELIHRGSGPYFYLPKLESYTEARLWNDVFCFAQETLGIPHGTIRATVLIETISAAFEMEEILYELRDHSAGLNAGRWDYIFSAIKKFRNRSDCILPDRSQITMTAPFMRAYTERLVKICHKRGAHAIGGMAAFIPSRRDPEINKKAIAKVNEDKMREAQDGFDGTWVAHPDLVPVAKEVFDQVLGNRPHQKDRQRDDVEIQPADLLNFQIPNSSISEAGARLNINVALQYLNQWLQGTGAAAIHNLMEDAATAEISRAQLWQWIHHHAKTEEGFVFNREFYEKLKSEELETLGGSVNERYEESSRLLDNLVTNQNFEEFLTLQAYQLLD